MTPAWKPRWLGWLADLPRAACHPVPRGRARPSGAGGCRTDLHILEGQWADKSQLGLPHTIGHENAGWVHAVGTAVTNVALGDKVILHPLVTCGLGRTGRAGDNVHCEDSQFPGINTDGGYAEYLKTSARSYVQIDDSLEPSDVAALADAGLTAYRAAAKASTSTSRRSTSSVSLHTAKYALADFQTAIDDLGGGHVRGRAILVPSLTPTAAPARGASRLPSSSAIAAVTSGSRGTSRRR